MNSKITGHATSQATQAFADRMNAHHSSFEANAYRRLIGTDLITSKIGYGTYRVHDQNEEHAETLETAIEAGCNLIDTSSNYTDGGSETLIGVVLQKMISANKIKREEIILVSKVGYMQGQNLEQAQQRETSGNPWEDVVKYMEGCWHCIHPNFLIDQWTHSTDRLELETIDVYLLHNPEYFLSHAKNQAAQSNWDTIRDAFYDRVYRAFVQMERFVAEGKIRYYGLSSNTFPSHQTDFEHVSLNRVYEAATKAAETVYGDHAVSHFKVIQLPYNLLESEALTEANNEINGTRVTVLEAAKSLGLGLLVNRPLNAFKNNQMTRLAQYEHRPNADYPSIMSIAEGTLVQIETRLAETLKSWGIFDSIQNQANVHLFYDVAQQLGGFMSRIQDRNHWEQILQQHLIPQINAYLRQTGITCMDQHQAEWEGLLAQYVEALNSLFVTITEIFNRVDAEKVEPVSQALNLHLSDDQGALSLSQRALNFVASSAGVSVVLNGMKREEYVEDAMGIMEMPDFPQPLTLIESVARTT